MEECRQLDAVHAGAIDQVAALEAARAAATDELAALRAVHAGAIDQVAALEAARAAATDELAALRAVHAGAIDQVAALEAARAAATDELAVLRTRLGWLRYRVVDRVALVFAKVPILRGIARSRERTDPAGPETELTSAQRN
jgi:hypothetical protein